MRTSRRALLIIFALLVTGASPSIIRGADHPVGGEPPPTPALACLRSLLGQVVDPHGETYRQLATWLDHPNVDGKTIIDYLSHEPKLKALFAGDAGVWEGYSIREHTLMVYDNYADQSPHFHLNAIRTPENVNVSRLMKFTVALHDIGKPEAIKAGNKALQHKYTTPILVEKLRQLEFSEAEVAIAKAVVDNDVLGDFLKGMISPEQAYEKISSIAATTSVSPRDYFRLQSFFYTIDAAAYPTLKARIFSNLNGKLVPLNPRYQQLEKLFDAGGK